MAQLVSLNSPPVSLNNAQVSFWLALNNGNGNTIILGRIIDSLTFASLKICRLSALSNQMRCQVKFSLHEVEMFWSLLGKADWNCHRDMSKNFQNGKSKMKVRKQENTIMVTNF